MENSHKNLDKITNDWLGEAGLEEPSANFVHNVMDAIEAKSVVKQIYRPLISKKGWVLVAVFFLSSLLSLYFFSVGQLKPFDGLDLSIAPYFKNALEGVTLSKTMVYSIGFLALFLVQIPFLKRRFIN